MRKLALVSVVLAAAMLVTSATQAISAGRGGRMYFTTHTGNYINLWSIGFSANWDNIGLSPVAQVQHGQVFDSSLNIHSKACYSPEIENPGQAPGYAKVVMGLWNDNTPTSCQNPSVSAKQTMDVLRITPTTGSNTVTVLGTGKANYKNDWNGREATNTDGGLFAYPDPGQQFTGGANRWITSNSNYRSYTYINKDYNSSGSITDDNNNLTSGYQGSGDYLARATTMGYQWDMEIEGNRMYDAESYSGHRRVDTGAILYIANTGGASPALSNNIWYDDNTAAYKNPQLIHEGTGGMAAATVKGKRTTWIVGKDTYNTNTLGIYMLQDLNGNGEAMDNAQVTGSRNEYKLIYSAASVSSLVNNPGITSALDDPNAGWTDMEFMRNPGDNKMFLVVQCTTQDAKYGTYLLALQLDDNGDYTGGNANAKVIMWSGMGGSNAPLTGFTFGNTFEIDMAVPEPATTALVGTGVFSFIGWLRRRRAR